jgi:zinc transporter ZupT
MGLSDKELAFLLVCGAGLSTGIGAGVVYSKTIVQVTSKAVLAGSLGLSAGVMLYVSFVEILQKSILAFEDAGTCLLSSPSHPTLILFSSSLLILFPRRTSTQHGLFIRLFVLLWRHHHDAHDRPGTHTYMHLMYLHASTCIYMRLLTTNTSHFHSQLVHYLDPNHMNHDDIDFDMMQELLLREDGESPAETKGPAAEGKSLELVPLTDSPLKGRGACSIEDGDGGAGSGSRAAEGGSILDVSTPGEGEGSAIDEQAVRDKQAIMDKKKEKIDKKLNRMGLMTALAIAIHNFPEGLATFVATLSDPSVGNLHITYISYT